MEMKMKLSQKKLALITLIAEGDKAFVDDLYGMFDQGSVDAWVKSKAKSVHACKARPDGGCEKLGEGERPCECKRGLPGAVEVDEERLIDAFAKAVKKIYKGEENFETALKLMEILSTTAEFLFDGGVE